MKKQTAMQYKRAFLKANNCTARKFEQEYIKFAESKPTDTDYRNFAEKWGITIHEGLGSSRIEALLSVNIAAIKVMATNEREARHAIQDILSTLV